MEKKKLNIVFLSFYSGHIPRGVETFVHELSNQLVSIGHNVTVIQNGPKVKNSSYSTISIGLPVDWKHTSKSKFPFTSYWELLIKRFTSESLKRIDKNSVDIIFPTNGRWQAILCRIWAFVHRKIMIVSGQSGPGFDDRCVLWCFPNVFVGMTKYHVEWAKHANPFVKLATIPNGVDITKFNNSVKPIKIDLPRPIIVSVAAFVPNKRLDLAIKAVAKLQKGSLLLIGSGQEHENLTKLGNKLLPGRFMIKSAVYEDIQHIYPSVDLFTFPTVAWESFGIVMLEAMASGLAVVGNDDPIRKEIIGNAGFVVDPTDTEKYSQVLQNAIDKDWHELPIKRAEHFSWIKIANQYEEIFIKSI